MDKIYVISYDNGFIDHSSLPIWPHYFTNPEDGFKKLKEDGFELCGDNYIKKITVTDNYEIIQQARLIELTKE